MGHKKFTANLKLTVLILVLIVLALVTFVAASRDPKVNQESNPVVINTKTTDKTGVTQNILMTSDGLMPWTVSIKKGTRVIWTNVIPPEVTIEGNGFTSKKLRQNDSYEYIFSEAGRFEYKAGSVVGVIIVE